MPNKKQKVPTTSEISGGTPSEKQKVDKLALEIGRRIVQARNGLGLSQQAVHTRSKLLDPEGVGVSRAALSLYEIGTNKPGAREILLLCEVLSVSPNWLLFGSESPARTLQPTTLFLAGDALDISARLAFAILALNSSDRDSIANIVFSMLNSKLGDVKLASLMTMATMLKNDLHSEVLSIVGDEANNLSFEQLIEKFLAQATEGFVTNWGTLRPPISDEQLENKEIPPTRSLK